MQPPDQYPPYRYTSPDETTEPVIYPSPYWNNPYSIPPPPPKPRADWKRLSLLLICALLLITSVVLGYLSVNALTKPETTVPAKLVTVVVTPTSPIQTTSTATPALTPTPTARKGLISRTPLLEKNAYGDWQCYVINDPLDTSLFAVLSNSSSRTLFTDCANFMGQGNYYSTPPLNSTAGDTLQCEAAGVDNTVWKVQARYNDLPTQMMCSDLGRTIPGTQG